MRFPVPWARRILAATLLLIGVGWVTAKSSQYLFRSRAEKLFTDFQTIQVSRSSTADAQALLRRWARYGSVTSNCNGNTCRMSFDMMQRRPVFFCGQVDGGIRNVPAILADLLGFRIELVRFELTSEGGVVSQKSFGLDVTLPLVEWYRWNKSYFPDLAVWSSEVTKFAESTRLHPSHPFRIARNVNGVYGLTITFTPEETAAEQAELMHFRFSCLTQFLPCQNFAEILPEGWRTLQQDYPELQK